VCLTGGGKKRICLADDTLLDRDVPPFFGFQAHSTIQGIF
jgi:hypothetical protein